MKTKTALKLFLLVFGIGLFLKFVILSPKEYEAEIYQGGPGQELTEFNDRVQENTETVKEEQAELEQEMKELQENAMHVK
jgi:hypothetical protein